MGGVRLFWNGRFARELSQKSRTLMGLVQGIMTSPQLLRVAGGHRPPLGSLSLC